MKLMTKTTLRRRIAFREKALERLYDAYKALVETGVKSYQMDDRTLTRLDLPALSEEITKMEDELDELEALLSGVSARKAVAIVPRDW